MWRKANEAVGRLYVRQSRAPGLIELVGPVQGISANFHNNKELGVVCFPAMANSKQNNTHEKNIGPNVAKPESVRGKCKSARSILELENDPCG